MRLAVGVLILLAAPAFGQGAAVPREGPRARAGLAAALAVGTHETMAGARASMGARLAAGRRAALWAVGEVQGAARLRDLGLPGPSLGAEVRIGLALAFGPPVAGPRAPGVFGASRRHRLAYSVIEYVDTDGTTQMSGSLIYRRASGQWVAEATIENDALSPEFLDRWRTGGARLRLLYTGGDVPVGGGARFVAWTGTTEGLSRRGPRGPDGRRPFLDTYDLTGQLGAEYPHGILALDVVRGGLTLSVGVDAEAIRTAVQDPLHWLARDGRIPAFEGHEPRLFLRLALNEGATLY